MHFCPSNGTFPRNRTHFLFFIFLSVDLDIPSKLFRLEDTAYSITLLLKNKAKTIGLQINQTNENTINV